MIVDLRCSEYVINTTSKHYRKTLVAKEYWTYNLRIIDHYVYFMIRKSTPEYSNNSIRTDINDQLLMCNQVNKRDKESANTKLENARKNIGIKWLTELNKHYPYIDSVNLEMIKKDTTEHDEAIIKNNKPIINNININIDKTIIDVITSIFK